jgi:hypothetical protein
MLKLTIDGGECHIYLMGFLTAGPNIYFAESCVDLSLAWMPWQKEPDRQCGHKGILRRIHATTVKGISITYSGYMFVALGKAMLMHHMVICRLSGCTIYFHIVS